jgi:hypothetical protein
VFFISFFCIIIFLIYRAVSGGGLRAMLYNRKIDEKIGKVESTGNSSVTIDLLSGKDGIKNTGITISKSCFAGYRMLSASLSKNETQKLIEYLQQAMNKQ